jgi:hypothetical protein
MCRARRVVSPPGVLQTAGLFVLTALAFAGVAHVPVFVDEANNVLGACLLAHGSVPYRDFFFHHFPLEYYLLAALGPSGGCSVIAGRYLGLTVLLLATAAFTAITQNRLAPLALLVIILSGPAYYAQLYLAEVMVSAGLILNLALLTDRGLRLRGPAVTVLRVVALVILISSSPIGIMMAAITGLLMLVRARGQRLLGIAAGAIALLIWPFIMLVQGALPAFVDQAFTFNTQIYSNYLDVKLTSPISLLWQALSFVRHRFSFVVDWGVGQDTKANAATFAASFELALVVLLAALILMNRRELLLRVALVLLFPLTVARDGFHLAPFITLASLGCAQLMWGRVGRSRLVQAGGVIVAVLALRIYFLFLPTDLGAPDDLAASLESDSRVMRYADPNDTILYLPMSPDGYLANNRRPGSFYSFFLPWEGDIPGAEDRLIADIERNHVAVIVMDQDAAVWEKYRLRDYAPRLTAYVLEAYRPIDSGDPRQARIFVRDVR